MRSALVSLGVLWLSLGFAVTPAYSQHSPWQAGLIAGLSRTSLAGRPDADPRAGWSVGGFAQRRIGSAFALRGELLVATGTVEQQVGQCGAFSCLPQPVTDADITATRFRSAQFPVMLILDPSRRESRSVSPMLYGGGFAGLQSGCQSTTTLFGAKSRSSCTSDLRQLDAGFVLGGGVRYRGVGLSVRWTRGLLDLDPEIALDGGSAFNGGRSSSLAVMIDVMGIGR